MAIEFFGAFDNGRPREEYLRLRARIRRELDFEYEGSSPQAPSEGAIAEVAEQVGDYTWSNTMTAAGDLALDSAAVGAEFAAKVDDLARDLQAFLCSPIARVAGAIEVRPEVAFVDVALSALCAVSSAPDGLDVRCEDLRQELNQLERMLDQSGETGDVESWEPATKRQVRSVVDLDGPGGCDDVDLDSSD